MGGMWGEGGGGGGGCVSEWCVYLIIVQRSKVELRVQFG